MIAWLRSRPRARAPEGQGVRRAIRAALWAQTLIALVLVIEAGGPTLPGGAGSRTAPPMEPGRTVAPGDQSRRYMPTRAPGAPETMRPDAPPGVPMPDTVRLPETLRIDEVRRPDIGRVMTLTGAIDPGAAARVAEHLDRLTQMPDAVALHSPGGVVDEALAIGRELRRRGLPTRVPAGAICLSACPYILAGGDARTVSAAASVGVHQSFYDQSAFLPVFAAVAEIQAAEAAAMRYLAEMGVDPLVRIPALETPSRQIYLLTPDELTEYRLATEVVDRPEGRR